MLGIGPVELLIVLFVMFLLFGSKLPNLMYNLGRSAVEFQRGASEP